MTSSSAFERLFHSLIVFPIKNFVVIFSLIIPQYFVLLLTPYSTPSGQSILLPDLESSSHIYTGFEECKSFIQLQDRTQRWEFYIWTPFLNMWGISFRSSMWYIWLSILNNLCYQCKCGEIFHLWHYWPLWLLSWFILSNVLCGYAFLRHFHCKSDVNRTPSTPILQGNFVTYWSDAPRSPRSCCHVNFTIEIKVISIINKMC